MAQVTMQIYWKKKKYLHKTTFQIQRDWFWIPTWPVFCFICDSLFSAHVNYSVTVDMKQLTHLHITIILVKVIFDINLAHISETINPC